MSTIFDEISKQGISGAQMVDVVRRVCPKFDKTLISKCRNPDYGVQLREEPAKALRQEFLPLLANISENPQKKRDSSGHKLTKRIQCRLPDDEFEALQQRIKTDGYQTVQEWGKAMVKRYLEERK